MTREPLRKRYARIKDQVKRILEEKAAEIQACATIQEAYTRIDWEWLKREGLPWLDYDIFRILSPRVHQFSTVERAARGFWDEAKRQPELAHLRLPDHLEAQRQRGQNDWRGMMGREGSPR